MDQEIMPETPVTAEIEDGRIRLDTNFRDRDLVTLVPGATWDRIERRWYSRLSWSACVQLRGIFGDRLQVGPELEKWAWREVDERIHPALHYRDAEDVPNWDEPDLYPRQKAGVAFLVKARHALLADEVGAGKTRQIIKAAEIRETYPMIVICTKSAKDSWAEEFEKVAPHRKVQVVSGSADKRRKQLAAQADVYIIHWQIVRLHTRLAGYGFIKLSDEEKQRKELNEIHKKAVVVDEGHRMKDPKSKQTRAVWALGDEIDDLTGMRVDATGTPIEKDCSQLWAQLRFISPREFPSKTKFVERYALQTWSPFGFTEIAGLLPEHKVEFFKILDPRFIRRPTRVVVPGLPQPIRPTPRYVELTGKQKKAYKQMADGLLAEVAGGTIMAKEPLTQAIRLRQLAGAYGEVVIDPQTQKPTLKMTGPSVVIDDLMDYLEEIGAKQSLIFAESRQLIELAAAAMDKAGINHSLITGLVGEAERTQRRKDFQDGRIQHLLLTTGAGGESLTLTAAEVNIFIERPFSLIANKQAEGRSVRPGQTTNVVIQDIIPTLGEDKHGAHIHTIAGHAYETLVVKGQSFEEVVRDEEILKKVFKDK